MPPGTDTAFDDVADAGKQGNVGQTQFGGGSAGAQHSQEVADEAESRDVCRRSHADLHHRLAARAVELPHRGDSAGDGFVVGDARLGRRRDDAGAERLRQHQFVADLGGGVRDDVVGVDDPR